ncbi:MAG TPA: hypothetical protein VGL53_05570 [Bryobacteraceae bacterium]|jgi:hypothetical protein
MPNDPLDRRTLVLGFLGGAAALWAADESFPGDQESTLKALASTVLPPSMGAAEEWAIRFAAWVRGYTPGAEMEHGYGFTKLEERPPSPAPRYVNQLRELAAKGFVAASPSDRLALVEASLADAKALPRIPAGANVAADLMSFYFHSAEAADTCYDADIRADACRGFTRVGESPLRRKS